MPSGQKRHRTPDDSDDVASESQAESSESADEPAVDKRKRVRLSDLNGSDQPSSEESEESEEGDEDDGIQDEADGVVDDEADEDVSQSDEDEDGDADKNGSEDDANDAASSSDHGRRNPPTRVPARSSNSAASSGIIQSIICINFMCHSRLQVDAGPLINFIIGHNGSGKSAILAALTLCLGGKAADTNRGTSLKSFIKHGEEFATVIVKLKNEGIGAYQHEVYGDSIIVERSFSRTGSSSFKVKNSDGKIISTKRDDLSNITDHFSLQMDNPMNVLSQDAAREFLLKSTPRSKYKFFLRGVQLERLQQDYELVSEALSKTQAKLEDMPDHLKILRDQRDRARNLWELARRQDSSREKVKQLEDQYLWLQVEKEERYKFEVEQQLQQSAQTIQESEVAVETASASFDAATEEHEQAKRNELEANEQREPIEDKKKQLNEDFSQGRARLTELLGEERTVVQNLRAKKKEAERTQTDITGEENRLNQNSGENMARLSGLIEDAQANLKKYEDRIKAKEEERAELDSNVKRSEEDISQIMRPIFGKKKELDECRQRLRSIQNKGGEQTDGFGPNMPRLLKAIQSYNGFREKPVGPVAHYVTLLKPQWSSVLEMTLGKTLSAFIVTNKADQEKLSELARRHDTRITIFIGNQRQIDTSAHEPGSEYQSILSALEISDDLVRSQLIIGLSIEQTILIEDPKEGIAAMYDSGSGPLKNVKACLCLHATKIGWGNRLAYGSGGSAVSNPVKPYRGKSRMRTDLTQQISMEKRNEEKLQSQLDDLESRRQALEDEKSEQENKLKACRVDMSNLRKEQKKTETRLNSLEDERERNNPDSGKLETLKQHIEAIQGEISVLEDALTNAIALKEQMNEKQEANKKERNELDQELAAHERQRELLEGATLKHQDARADALRAKNRAIELVATNRANHQSLEEKRQSAVERVERATSEAELICSRVEVPANETMEGLEKKIKKLRTDLREAERRLGADHATLERNYHAVERNYKADKKRLEEQQRLQEVLTASLKERRIKWNRFRHQITVRAKNQFVYLLQERGFRGKILVQHDAEKLDLQIQPDEASTSRGHGAKGLSGGEKSFSTVCLLLALWEAMGSPVRCLDEFDVFMDGVNRDVSAKMMVDFARKSIGRQFFLLTPLAMANLTLGTDVKVHRLIDPERGQTNLRF